jgi:signal transduction histidine kinase
MIFEFLFSGIKEKSSNIKLNLDSIICQHSSNKFENICVMSSPNSGEKNKFLNQYFNFLPEANTFTLFGDKIIEFESQVTHYEVFYRYSLPDSEIEMMFKDVTRSKLNELKFSDFKYKTVFLSKVAHEFKNPIVSMCELVDQSNDELDDLKQNNSKLIKTSLKKKFRQLKSLSDFLLILVKDLNYFSEYSLEKKIAIEEKETELKEIVEFAENITYSLLNKCNKSRFIKFQVDIDYSVPQKIKTDEWRLKQILVNLLSNSVKFTLNGEIKLRLFVEKKLTSDTIFLNFQVKDSGVGIKEEDKKKLFTPFQKGTHTNNDLGSGLGLFIANEISSKLGTGLYFNSCISNGSTFWFGIPIAQNTTKDIHFEQFDKSNESIITKKIEDLIICKKTIGLTDISMIHSRYASSSDDDSGDLEISQYQMFISNYKKESLRAEKNNYLGLDLVKDHDFHKERDFPSKDQVISENLTVNDFLLDPFSDSHKTVLK